MFFGYTILGNPHFEIQWFLHGSTSLRSFSQNHPLVLVQLPLIHSMPCELLEAKVGLVVISTSVLGACIIHTSWWLNHVHSNLKPIIRLVPHKFVNGGLATHLLLIVYWMSDHHAIMDHCWPQHLSRNKKQRRSVEVHCWMWENKSHVFSITSIENPKKNASLNTTTPPSKKKLIANSSV